MDTIEARKHMVDSQVRPNDVTDPALVRAMSTVPREAFVPTNRRSLAYVEKDVPLFDGRWLLKARDFSKLVHGATIQPGDLVLDIGCGYGYSSAVISFLAGVVVGLEADDRPIERATETCRTHGYDTVAFVQGSLAEGCPKQGPYDVIVIEGGIETLPDTLFAQLKPNGGRLVAIMCEDGVGHATLWTRHGEKRGHRILFEAYPAGILPGFEKERAFVF